MSRTVERYQNPAVGDDVRLRFITYNSNNLASVQGIEQVDIYFQDPGACTETDPTGCTLVESFDGSAVTDDGTGQYHLLVPAAAPKYTIGRYVDAWTVRFDTAQTSVVRNNFQLYPALWYTSTIPAVYSFGFQFQPNRVRKGSKKWLIIKINPNVPRATDLERYYTNLAISSDLRITIEQTCGPCVPAEADLRLVVDRALVDVREKVYGYYFLDTTEMDCGIYDVTFELEYAGSTEVSPKFQLQIF